MHVQFLVFLFISLTSCSNRSELLFSYITTVTGKFTVIDARPVVDLALEEINSRIDVLENYTLNYNAIQDSKACGSNIMFIHSVDTIMC